MVADNRFGYLGSLRYVLGYATSPVYWVADIPTRVSFLIDDVFVKDRFTGAKSSSERRAACGSCELQLLESLTSSSRLLELNTATADLERDVMPAEIIVVTDPFSRVLINKGADAGVFVSSRADANGLMGQVVEVLPFTSWVLLITDLIMSPLRGSKS